LIKLGQTVNVTQNELPGQTFKGQIVRSAASIDPSTRSLQVEISLSNMEGLLLPGAFVQAELALTASRSLAVANNAIIIRGEGTMVAVVDDSSVVHMKPVKLGRNFGEKVEILGGLVQGERLVLNPSDSLVAGDQVSFLRTEDDSTVSPVKTSDGNRKAAP
jgi:RND family efflux transporter MFP subunit